MAGNFELYNDKKGEFRFRLKVDGNNILASEGYKAKSGCTNGIESVKKNAPDDKRYELKETKSGKFMFNLKAGNSQIIATSSSYDSAAARDSAVTATKKNASNASVDDLT